MGVAIPEGFSYGADVSESQVKNTSTNATQEYQPVEIINIKPQDILPIISQVEE